MAATAAGYPGAGLRTLSILLGVFLLFMGIDKIPWFRDVDLLRRLFSEWLETAPAASRWYLERVALPGAPVFARVVPLAEMAAGLALVLGFRVRIVAALVLLMVLNFHFAADVMFHYAYLTNAYGLPIIGGLLALALGGGRLPYSVSR